MAFPKVMISKLDAARRQLDCAIELWFLDKDPVSIHTLLAASYQIICDINVHRGINHESLYDTVRVKDEYRKEWIKLVRAPMNFFKHADKDAEGSIEFAPELNKPLIAMAIHGLGNLLLPGGRSSDYERIFFSWANIHEPHLLKEDFLGKRVPADDINELRGLSKERFLKVSLEASMTLRAAGKIP